MTKEDYLIKKGRRPDPKQGEMFIIFSNRKGVTLRKLHVWDSKPSGTRTWSDGKKEECIKYCFNEAPWEIIKGVDETYSEESSYGTGFGDLWGHTFFGTFDEQLAQDLFEKETLRVKREYLDKTESDEEIIMPVG